MQSLLEQPQATPYGISASLVDQNTFCSRCKLFVAVGKMLGLLQAVFCSAFKRATEAPLYGVLLVAVDEDTGHPFRRFIAGNNVDSLQSLCLGRNNISSQSIHPTPCYDVSSSGIPLGLAGQLGLGNCRPLPSRSGSHPTISIARRLRRDL